MRSTNTNATSNSKQPHTLPGPSPRGLTLFKVQPLALHVPVKLFLCRARQAVCHPQVAVWVHLVARSRVARGPSSRWASQTWMHWSWSSSRCSTPLTRMRRTHRKCHSSSSSSSRSSKLGARCIQTTRAAGGRAACMLSHLSTLHLRKLLPTGLHHQAERVSGMQILVAVGLEHQMLAANLHGNLGLVLLKKFSPYMLGAQEQVGRARGCSRQ
mmetsp:Transcript_9499/g.24236  ORF Transcript_9499/g.24236 Transcript_9499/m.24236 type:complete len:213 (+) Transcript_9499:1207-1845(+)